MVKKIEENQYQCQRTDCGATYEAFDRALAHQKSDAPHVLVVNIARMGMKPKFAESKPEESFTVVNSRKKNLTALTGHLCSEEGARADAKDIRRYFELQDRIRIGINEIPLLERTSRERA